MAPPAQFNGRRVEIDGTADPELDYGDIAGRYLQELAERALRIDTNAVAAIAECVVSALRADSTVFIAGNGGSAAAAMHIACDWLTMCRLARFPHARIINLADNAATVTAIANDVGFARIFARQIEVMGRSGDVLVLLSVSGNSSDIVEAAATARERGLRVMGLFGNAGSAVRYCDTWTEFGDGDYGQTEDLHLAVNHIVVRILNDGQPRIYGLHVPNRTPDDVR